MRWILSALLLIALAGSTGQAAYLAVKTRLAQYRLVQQLQHDNTAGADIKPWHWADIHPTGLLEVPGLGIQQVVLDNQQGESLALGPRMVQGESSRVVAGRRDSFFAFLKELSTGDDIIFTPLSGRTERYRITDIDMIDAREHSAFSPPPDSLSLMTCYPFDGSDPQSRWLYVVVARRQSPPPQ